MRCTQALLATGICEWSQAPAACCAHTATLASSAAVSIKRIPAKPRNRAFSASKPYSCSPHHQTPCINLIWMLHHSCTLSISHVCCRAPHRPVVPGPHQPRRHPSTGCAAGHGRAGAAHRGGEAPAAGWPEECTRPALHAHDRHNSRCVPCISCHSCRISIGASFSPVLQMDQ